MDNTKNIFDYYTKELDEFEEKKTNFYNIIPETETVKKLLLASIVKNILPNEIYKLLIDYEIEEVKYYLNYIKEYIKRKYIKGKSKEFIKNKLIENINSLKFNNIYEVLLNSLLEQDFISNVIEYSDEHPIIITPEDCVKNTIENYTPRPNQKEAFDRLEKFGLETGIHCQATGCGKTIIILHYIDYCIKKFGNDCKIILFTERVNILVDLFDFNNGAGEANKENIKIWKEKGIADLTGIDIINRATIKKDWVENLNNANKPILIVINRAFLTKGKKYKDINNLSLILHDECHNTTSEQCHKFLLEQKKKNIPIVGFSATPLRTGKNDLPKLKDIYDMEEPLLTNYNMIYSINLGMILPPEFYWYHIDKLLIDKKDKNSISKIEIGTVLDILQKIVVKMPNRKLIAWCGKINMAKKWKKVFIEEHKQKPQLHNFKFFVDTSQNSNDEYEQFRKLDGNCILFCANKHREGSDIRNLDGCIFLDRVKNRGCIPFIQSIGRVLRKGVGKTKGYIIDGIYKDENYDKNFIDKIIGYYCNLENHFGELTNEKESKLETYIRIRDMVQFNKNKEEIIIIMGNNEIVINLNTLGWDDVIENFDNLLQKKIKLNTEDNMIHKGKILVEKFGFNSRTDFKKEYKNISYEDKLKYNLPDINSEDYVRIFNNKSWFDILGLKHDFYKSMVTAKKKLKENKIKLENAKNNWDKWCKIDNKLPPYPLYVWDEWNSKRYSYFEENNVNIFI
jgi:superfamily II DNA or RNA helicase